MAERKSVNKYYPPDWDPSKGSVNKHVGQHPLRDRAKKIKQGILVIRFEMPYNIWCGGCNAHIGMGVRYNAEKSKTGKYYSTPIYKFRMKCHLCDNYFEIQTDPQNHDYVILSGARRKEQRWDPKENGQIETEDKTTQKKMATDAMFKLEHGSDDKEKGKKSILSLSQLEDRMDQFRDDYLLNKLARNKFREEKTLIKEKVESDKALLDKSSLDIKLVEENDEDKKLAGLIKYSVVESFDEKQKEKRRSLNNESIFTVPKLTTNKFSHLVKNQCNPFNLNSTNLNKGKKQQPNLGIRRKSDSFIMESTGLKSEHSSRLSEGPIVLNENDVNWQFHQDSIENLLEERQEEKQRSNTSDNYVSEHDQSLNSLQDQSIHTDQDQSIQRDQDQSLNSIQDQSIHREQDQSLNNIQDQSMNGDRDYLITSEYGDISLNTSSGLNSLISNYSDSDDDT